MVGEDTVVDFFINLKNWETDLSKYTMRDGDVPSIFLPLEKLFKQDYSDINSLFEEGRGIKVYVGIRSSESNGKTYYDMDLYTKAFIKDYPGAKNFDKIINALKGEYSAFKKNIAPITSKFQEFNPDELLMEDSTETTSSNDMGFSDELPF